MSMTIQDANGVNVPVFAEPIYDAAGELLFLDLIGRADSMAVLEGALVERLIMRDLGEDGLGETDGANVSIRPSFTITPGEYDEDGNELVAPVIDPRPHFDIRLAGAALKAVNADGYEVWKETLLIWSSIGVDATPNAAEVGKVVSGITLFDPATISSRSRGWGLLE